MDSPWTTANKSQVCLPFHQIYCYAKWYMYTVHERVKHKIRKILYPFCLILKVQIKSFPPDAEGFGGKYFFNCVKEGDNVTFATDDENERTLWVQAIYRATGQTHKPVPPVVQTNKISNTQISRMQGGQYKSLILIISNAWPKIIVTNTGKSVRLGEMLARLWIKIKLCFLYFTFSRTFIILHYLVMVLRE